MISLSMLKDPIYLMKKPLVLDCDAYGLSCNHLKNGYKNNIFQVSMLSSNCDEYSLIILSV